MTLANDAISYLRSPQTIRERCQQLFDRAEKGELSYFLYHPAKLSMVAEVVLKDIKKNYPDLKIPLHGRYRHFEMDGIDRLEILRNKIASFDDAEKTRSLTDLVVVSVLLDAGAGTQWQYREEATGKIYSRSEGLAAASFTMFMQGFFAISPKAPYQVDAARLKTLTVENLTRALQVTTANPLVGLAGRLTLLKKLGDVLELSERFLGTKSPRPAALFDYGMSLAKNGTLQAKDLLSAILTILGPIWPGRLAIDGANLGDVWRHPQVQGEEPTAGLVPFHKLSQWLTYSLVEPFAEGALTVTGLHELTGLPEYRNGGLFLDYGVITPRDPKILASSQKIDAPLIVEWRALTVILLDKVAQEIQRQLRLSPEQLPLAKILQGGTWNAGRLIAKTLRPDGGPPIHIESDGTVF